MLADDADTREQVQSLLINSTLDYQGLAFPDTHGFPFFPSSFCSRFARLPLSRSVRAEVILEWGHSWVDVVGGCVCVCVRI